MAGTECRRARPYAGRRRETRRDHTGILRWQNRAGINAGHAVGCTALPALAQTLDVALVEIEHGKATFQGTPQLMHCNPMGTVHGSWFVTLPDSAVGCAVHTMMPVGRGFTTAELSVNIVRAASHKTGPLRATGTVIHCGKQLATAEDGIAGPDGKL